MNSLLSIGFKKHRYKSSDNPESGYVLIIIISLLSILLVVGISFSGFAFYGFQRTNSLHDNMQSYYLARSGLQQAYLLIQTRKITGNELKNEIIPLDQSTTGYRKYFYHVKWSLQDRDLPGLGPGSKIIIKSRGFIQNNEKIIAEKTITGLYDPSTMQIIYSIEIPVDINEIGQERK